MSETECSAPSENKDAHAVRLARATAREAEGARENEEDQRLVKDEAVEKSHCSLEDGPVRHRTQVGTKNGWDK